MPKHKSEKWLSVIRSPEYKEKMRKISLKNGNKPPVRWGNKDNLGRKHTEEWKEEKRRFNKEHNIKPPKMLGKDNVNWKGGITSENEKIRKSIEFRLWRESVFVRDDWTCRNCLKRGGKLQAHHILPFAKFPELRFAINNGITLCKECHKKTNSYLKGA